jgi:hypothetical protein
MAAREAKAARAVVTPGRIAGGGMAVCLQCSCVFCFDAMKNAANDRLIYLSVSRSRDVMPCGPCFLFRQMGQLCFGRGSEYGFRGGIRRRTDAHGVDDRQYLMVKKWKSS